MIDTHCHLTHAKFAGDADDAIARALAAGVTACVTIGTGVEDGLRARELVLRHAGVVFATVGLDPFSSHAAGPAFDEAYAALAELLEAGGFVAVGEIAHQFALAVSGFDAAHGQHRTHARHSPLRIAEQVGRIRQPEQLG